MLALLAARLADEAGGFLAPGAFESFRSELGLSYTRASWVLVLAAPGAIAGNVFPILADHRSRRAIASAGAFGFAAALATFGLGRSFPVLAAASFAIGFSATALIEGTELALIDIAGDDVAAYVSRAHLFGAVGDLLGPALLILVAATGLGWRTAFLACAVGIAIYGVWLARLPLPPPSRPDPDGRAFRGVRTILGDRRVWLFGLVALLLGPIDEPFVAFVIAYLERARGLPAAAAISVALAWVAGTIVGFASTSRGRRPGADALLHNAVAIAASVAGAAVLPWIAAIIVCVSWNGLAVARFYVALKTRVVALHPGRVGSVNAVVSTIEFAGFPLPLLAGAAADAFGIHAGLACYAGLAAALLLVIAQASRARAI